MNTFNNQIYHDIIDCMAAALDAKDIYTAGHSTRVADTSYALGQCLGLNNDELELLHMAAHLHDIGKIGIPDNILNKNGSLTSEEFNIIKQHPKIGYDILSNSKSLLPIAEIVLHHHEKYNGTGYPDSLKGNSIPYNSRIISICDSIDAMLINRPYRNSLTIDYCKKEIILNKNIMYDPFIVDVLIANWKNIIEDYYLQ